MGYALQDFINDFSVPEFLPLTDTHHKQANDQYS